MYTELTLADIVREHRRSRPHRTAVVDGKWHLTYGEFDARTDLLAGALAVAGAGHGSRILWIGENSYRVLELLVAAAKIGAILCPANWRQSADELRFIVADLEPAVVLWDPSVSSIEPESAPEDGSRWVRCTESEDDEYESWLSSSSAQYPAEEVEERDPVLLLYTAAFDGRPNGALLSHRALIAHGAVLAIQRQIEEGFVFLDSGPMFHVGTMMFATATLMTGGTNVVLRRFDPEIACELIERERCQGAMLFPAMISQLVETNSEGRYDLSSLRFAPADPAWNTMVTADTSPWGRSEYGYGQTEVAGMLTYHALGIDGQGSHGRPSPLTQVRIVDPEDRDVPDGQVGEIVARGSHLLSGYFNRPELDTEKFRGGWYHTGDLGRREADGTLSFIGPKLRMIKSGGENIYPAEVERALLAHPDISAAAVIGRPDDDWGQAVHAVVVIRAKSEEAEPDLIAHVRRLIASYKKPRSIDFVDAIPMRGFVPDYDALDSGFGGGGYPGS
ncbi:AMP-binding protein [Nocardia flavorosea]|uniref:AMP-binding protein n=1 Tax=Nocardia flavorosea TaxID=53429 RepID=A0A846YIX5_9NOCA|nr:AMP-binding protein [Nocardia flavorosea]NKY57771.1 AMP-binding protein [Nocardia flavorosea]